jgi:hypothetical protein
MVSSPIFQPLGQDVDRLFGSATDWVGDGLSLSDRLWTARRQDRAAIDTILRHGLAMGADPLAVAKLLEDYLTPVAQLARFPEGHKRAGQVKPFSQQPKGVATRTPRGGMGNYAARRLARTETSYAFNEGIRQAADANPFVYGVRWNLSGTHKDADECDENSRGSSRGLPSGVYRPGEVPRIPGHPHCFPSGTLVSGPPVIGSTQRWYSGELVEIVTVDRHFLSVTPNHPILTDQGWVAAGLLNEGDDIICGDLAEWKASLVNPDNDNRPALIEDVAVTLGGSFLVATVSVPAATEDFHGDGEGSEVCVIRTNGELGRGLDSSISQPAGEQLLSGRNEQHALLSGFRVPTLLAERVRATTNSSVSGFGPSLAIFRRRLGHFQTLRGLAPTNRCLARNENPSDWPACDAEGASERQLGLSRDVSSGDFGLRQVALRLRERTAFGASDGVAFFQRAQLSARPQRILDSHFAGMPPLGADLSRVPVEVVTDRILKVSRRGFSGHVYNLQTTDGWYIANGIIVHNCRCYLTQETVENTDSVVAQLRRDIGSETGNVVQMPRRSSTWQKLVGLVRAAKALVTREAA